MWQCLLLVQSYLASNKFFFMSMPHKGTVAWHFLTRFFLVIISNQARNLPSKIFSKIFLFSWRNLQKSVFFAAISRVMIPENQEISGYCYPEISHFTSYDSQKSRISGYHYQDFSQLPSNDTCTFFVNKNLMTISVKLQPN